MFVEVCDHKSNNPRGKRQFVHYYLVFVLLVNVVVVDVDDVVVVVVDDVVIDVVVEVIVIIVFVVDALGHA